MNESYPPARAANGDPKPLEQGQIDSPRLGPAATTFSDHGRASRYVKPGVAVHSSVFPDHPPTYHMHRTVRVAVCMYKDEPRGLQVSSVASALQANNKFRRYSYKYRYRYRSWLPGIRTS
ncbi:hypothetical protein TsFJ059_001521 [Trichoderma semiorbis]|uniref:Uncharacterized protein n=1 Tax=Trichoderma semiorbis TaxID=1491008 RepID=A0A9P8HXR3_9HYPO|nr:hypothetical protein TsFJ059_001521 [Trichoderma semiorbis]